MQLLEEIKHASLNQTKIAVEHSELLMKESHDEIPAHAQKQRQEPNE